MGIPDCDFYSILGPNGPLAQVLGEYEHRPTQIKMAQTIWQALAEERHALVEAGTGTGKSIAYLVPILLAEKTVIVSTANKALQSQLYEKDVPLVCKALGLDLETVLIKGRRNYVCLRKYQFELPQQRAFAQIDGIQAYDLDELEDWVRDSETGDLEDLPFVLDSDTLNHITCPADECLHHECLYYDRCFVMRVRQRAAKAQVVITNHHLLISDLHLRTIGGVILPDTDVIVCDEAHQIESVATSIFETTVTDYTVTSLLLRGLVREHASPRQLDTLAEQNRAFFEGVRGSMEEKVAKLEGDWEEGLRLGHSVRDLAASLARLDPYGNDPDMEEENTRFGLAVQAVRRASEDIATVSQSTRDNELVRFAEQVRRRHVSLVLHATPISAAQPLGKHLFGSNTVLCTSATLAAGGTFELFKSQCGVQGQPLELIGEPVFDFPNQASIYVPQLRTYDWKNKEQYFEAVADETYRLLEVSRGRTFCLFTSWAGMQYVADKLRAKLPWPVMVQGELPRFELLRLFKNTPHSVLFGTKSFWEGVDVPGEALSQVIIDKLPFPSPRDPLHEARVNRVTQEGRNSFTEFTLPLMILALKQGFGRLIRTKTDRGVVALLDNRLVTKRYGSLVLRSLPPARLTHRFADVYRFFSVGPWDADYALTVWLEEEEQEELPLVQCRWQLTCLPDGRTKSGTGVGPVPQVARWTAISAGIHQLQEAIRRGKRQASDFKIEIRLPGVGGDGTQVLETAQPELQDMLQSFGAVHILPLQSETET